MTTLYNFFLNKCTKPNIKSSSEQSLKALTNKDGSMLVDICCMHHCHLKQVEHTRIMIDRQEGYATKLQHGVSKEKILNEIREESVNECHENVKRYHLADKLDLLNIKKTFWVKKCTTTQKWPN